MSMRRIGWPAVAFIALVLGALWLRFSFYEPLDRSISNYDTDRYALSSESSIFSLDFYTSTRQPTIALAYQLAETSQGYDVTNLSSPGDQIHPPLQVQPGFGRITALQAWLGVAAWIGLALAVYRNLRNPAVKVLGATLVLAFGFVPQVVESDYVMLSEPISLSLFVILLAITIELAGGTNVESKTRSRTNTALLGLGSVVFVLWLFARDTNAYMIPAFLAAIAGLAIWRPTRVRAGWRTLAIAAGVLILLFFAVSRTGQLSDRWVNPYFNNILARVLPIPEHRAFFEARGLPVSQELLAEVGGNLTELSLFELDDLVAWVREKGPATYIEFILTHPAWALGTFIDGTQLGFTENIQPFFRRSEITPGFLVYLGDLLHPFDANIIFLILVQLVLLAWLAFARKDKRTAGFAFLFAIVFIGDLLTLFMAVHGDAGGIVRHATVSVVPLRLMLWLLIPFIGDAYLAEKAK